MEQASSSALFAVRASELAATRASDPRLRAIAQTIALDQKAIGAQLSFAGRRVNLLPSARLVPLHQLLFDELEGSTDFDLAYRRKLLPVLTMAERFHRDFAERGPSPTLRPVAEMAAPVTRRNLEQLGGKASR
jgi:putative membrane protein